MNKKLSTPELTNTMSSLEIAELTDKKHLHILRDVRNIIKELKDNPDLVSGFKSSTYIAGNGKKEKCYLMDELSVNILITGYSVLMRARVIARWQYLEEQTKNKISGFQDRVQSIRDKRDSHKPMMDGLVFRRDMLGKDTGTNHFTNENLFCNRALTGEWKPIDESELDTYDLRLLKAIRERNTLLIQHYPVQKDRKQLLDDFVIEYKTKHHRLQLVKT